MAIEAKNDTVSYQGSDGLPKDAIGVVVMSGAGGGSSSLTVKAANYTPRSPAQQITIATLVTSQALTVATNATTAILQNNTTQAIRWRDDGSAPTASFGQRIPAGEQLTYDGSLSALRLIREADGTGTLDIAYYS